MPPERLEVGNEFSFYNRTGGDRGPVLLTDEAAASVEYDLDVTAFAPPAVRHGETFLLQIFVHLAEHATKAAELAKEFDAASEARAATSLLEGVTPGTRLEFQLQLRQGNAETTRAVLRWTGQPQSVQFLVTADSGPSQTALFGTVTISRDSVPIGQLVFKVLLATTASTERPEAVGTIDPFRQFFISYASKDRSEVIKRVQMLPRLGKNFRQDLLDLDPGDRWERKLYEFIRECDATLLFWSSNAKESEWVLKECQFCIEHKGIERLLPVIIERPPPLPPPELAELHMNDRLLYFVE